MENFKRTWAEIDTAALQANISVIKSKIGEKQIIAVVKANAYGNGVEVVAPALWELGIRHYAVACQSEAAQLRQILPQAEIIEFGFADTRKICDFDCIYSAPSTAAAHELDTFAKEKGRMLRVHVKLDTGMTRTGISTSEELEEILCLKHLKVEALYTHFAVSDSDRDDDINYTDWQYKKMLEIARERGLLLHCQNSGGILQHCDYKSDFVRAGISMYGFQPDMHAQLPEKLTPIMQLKSVVWQTRQIKKGTYIGYGRTFCAERDMNVAVVPVGYADGYSRLNSNSGSVAIRGKIAKVVGRVCMDQMMVDVSDIPEVKAGDEVLVYSHLFPETHIDTIAERLGTISYEVLCNVSARVPRIGVSQQKLL